MSATNFPWEPRNTHATCERCVTNGEYTPTLRRDQRPRPAWPFLAGCCFVWGWVLPARALQPQQPRTRGMDWTELEQLATQDLEAMELLGSILQRSKALQSGLTTKTSLSTPTPPRPPPKADTFSDLYQQSPAGKVGSEPDAAVVANRGASLPSQLAATLSPTVVDSDIAAVRSTLSRAQSVATTALRRHRQQEEAHKDGAEVPDAVSPTSSSGASAVQRMEARYDASLSKMRESYESEMAMAVSEAERRVRAQMEALHLSAMGEARDKWKAATDERVKQERTAQARETELLVRQAVERERRAAKSAEEADVSQTVADAVAAAVNECEAKWRRALREGVDEEARRWEHVLEDSLRAALTNKEAEYAQALRKALDQDASKWKALMEQEVSAATAREREAWEARVPDLVSAALTASKDATYADRVAAERVEVAVAAERTSLLQAFAREKAVWADKCAQAVAEAVLVEATEWRARCKALSDAATATRQASQEAEVEREVRDRVKKAVADAHAEWAAKHNDELAGAVRDAVESERQVCRAKAADDLAAVKTQMQNRLRKAEADAEAAAALASMEHRAAMSDLTQRYEALQSKYDRLEVEFTAAQRHMTDLAASKRSTEVSLVFEKQHLEQAARQLVCISSEDAISVAVMHTLLIVGGDGGSSAAAAAAADCGLLRANVAVLSLAGAELCGSADCDAAQQERDEPAWLEHRGECAGQHARATRQWCLGGQRQHGGVTREAAGEQWWPAAAGGTPCVGAHAARVLHA